MREAGYIAAMGAGSTGDDRWWRDFDGFVLGLLDGPSRILDVGSGDGSLGQRLREAGHEVVGVDPNALDELAIRARIEELEPAALGRFDLVCASMALHHIDLRGALDAIAAVLVPDGLFVVNEFDWPAYDARAAAWVDEPESGDPVEHFATEHETCTPAARCWRRSAPASRYARSSRGRTSRACCAVPSASRTSERRSRPVACRHSASGSLRRSRQRRPDGGAGTGLAQRGAAAVAQRDREEAPVGEAYRRQHAVMTTDEAGEAAEERGHAPRVPTRGVDRGTAVRTPCCARVKARERRVAQPVTGMPRPRVVPGERTTRTLACSRTVGAFDAVPTTRLMSTPAG